MKRESSLSFGKVLDFYMKRDEVTADALSSLTRRLFGEHKGVAKSTIVHWRSGEVAHPRNWNDVVKVAVALRLAQIEATKLLQSASFPSVSELLVQTTDTRLKEILAEWDKLVARGTMQGMVMSLHQLPAPKLDFTGRQPEIAQLLSELRTTPVAGVFGLGGVGKTTLALKLAAILSPQLPDAQLFVRLGGTSIHPVNTVEAMKQIIRSFHREEKIPEDSSELERLYYSVLHGRKALMLLDDALDAKQVGALIPPEGWVLLITSRSRFTLPGMFSINLDKMTPDEAKALLLRIVPRIGNHASEVARLCGYLPLALRLAGGAFAVQHDIQPNGYIERLANERLQTIDSSLAFTDEEKGVEASLALSHQLLSVEMSEWWCKLSIFPDSFDYTAAAAIWGLEKEQARSLLSDLLLRNMVNWNAETGRYTLHDLSRAYASAKLDKDTRTTSCENHALYYESVIRDTNTLYLRGGDGIGQALSLFDLESVNIHTGRAWAAANTDSNKWALELCASYPSAASNVLPLRLSVSERIQWRTDALRAARILKNRRLEGSHLSGLGLAYFHLGENLRAIELYKEALEKFREVGFCEGESSCLGNLGIAFTGIGDHRQAIKYQRQALIIDRKTKNRRGQAHRLNNLGLSYEHLGRLERATVLYKLALKLYGATGHMRGEGYALGNLGSVYLKLGKSDEALYCLERQLQIGRSIGDRRTEANALRDIGTVQCKRGNGQRAIELLEEALDIYDQIGAQQHKAIALESLGEAFDSIGEYIHSKKRYEQSLEIACTKGFLDEEALARWQLSLLIYRHGNRSEAIFQAEIALGIYQQLENPQASRVYEELTGWKSEAPI